MFRFTAAGDHAAARDAAAEAAAIGDGALGHSSAWLSFARLLIE